MPGILKLALKSIRYYRKQVLYQFLITAILCAVITGSLLTGHSVRSSLKRTASEHLGNTGILVSSGLRYFDRDLAVKLRGTAGLDCIGLLEIRGSSQAMATQQTRNNTIIYAVQEDFFGFHGNDTLSIKPGEAIINKRLADHLAIREGDDIAIRFSEISDIPADAPFAPENTEGMSMVLKVGAIAGPESTGNFSLSISQITPFNVFINLSELDSFYGKASKLNRLIVRKNSTSYIPDQIEKILADNLEIHHAGFRIRETSSGETEIISNRVFIEETVIRSITERIPSAEPVLTYLANRIEKDSTRNPYSFVSAVPSNVYPEGPKPGTIVINKWLSDDLNSFPGDSLKVFWYAPDSLNQLVEKSRYFIVEKVVEMKGIWADQKLMPDFPGITGAESCSRWDAGVPIKTNEIRQKDEDYWSDFRGTPKAFIDYSTGKEIWGSNYGPATAIRFADDITPADIESALARSLDPGILGFTITDIYSESLRAADNSVDFGTLFLSLGFFLIFAAFILLSFAVSYYFDLKSNDIAALFALGFKNSEIRKVLFTESMIISSAGCLAGAFSGYLVNGAIISALNSVWRGAVQTNTLVSAFDIITIVFGFLATFLIIVVFMLIKTRSTLKRLSAKGRRYHENASPKLNFRLLIISMIAALTAFVLSRLNADMIVAMSFISGMLMFVVMIFLWRQYYLGRGMRNRQATGGRKMLSHHYYSFFPSHAITPVLFIAAGMFAVFITVVNRKEFDSGVSDRSSGTGGYKLWMETAIPVSEDLTANPGRSGFGFDEDSLESMKFIQMKRSPGNDASCLNLNHITVPPLLGADPSQFISDGAFSFARSLPEFKNENPWQLLEKNSGPATIYGIADQTVLDWGLKLAVGDTIILRAESGQPLNIIIAGGLKSSVFQGFIIISKNNFTRFYPSVAGHSVFLVECNEPSESYRELLSDRFSNHGADIVKTSDRLGSFYEITNTYLSVFGVFGGFGMITGIAGLGFVLLRNYSHRRREFALMIASGFTFRMIRNMIFSEQLLILSAGVISGLVPAIVATLPSLRSNHEIPWIFLMVIVAAIFLTGILAVTVSLRSIRESSLVTALRKE